MGRQQLSRGAGSGTGPPAPRGDDTGCTILHVDMDAFYASVELRDRPELVGTPVIVGGRERGVVLSATYEARALGVHSAMPVMQAKRLCPTAVFLPPHFEKYTEASAAVRTIFHSVTPVVEPLALDEAFLDVAGAITLLGSAATIGDRLRTEVYDQVGIRCSVGVATNKFVAKLATNHAKPDGLFVVPADGIIDFLHPLPVGALWGVGAKTEERLHRVGVQTVGEVAHLPVAQLQRLLGTSAGAHLHELAWGRDPRRVVPDATERSVGAERTFDHDLTTDHEAREQVLRLSELVGSRVRRHGVVARTVVLKVRTDDFATITRSRTLAVATDVAHEIHTAARVLLDAVLPSVWGRGSGIRLLGVRVEQLSSAADHQRQMVLGEPDHGWREAESAIDEAARRFGPGAVRPATLLRSARGADGGAHQTPRSTDQSAPSDQGGGADER
jgi:DNA polymerase-4